MMSPNGYAGDASESREYLPFDVTNFTLHRNNRELGFNVIGGKDAEHMPGVSSPFVGSVRPNSDAHRQGLNPGDRILQIHDLDVSDMTHEEVVELLRQGETVKLTVEPNGEERIITETASIRSYVLPAFTQRGRSNDFQNNNTTKGSPHQHYIIEAVMDDRENIIKTQPHKEPTKLSESIVDKEFEKNVPESVYKRHSNAIFFGVGLAVGAVAILTYVQGRQFFNTFKGRIAAYFIKSAVMPETTVV